MDAALDERAGGCAYETFYYRRMSNSLPIQQPQPIPIDGTGLSALITSPSILNIIAALRKGPDRAGSDISSSPSVLLTPGGVDDSTGMTLSRDRTRRQLRLLFVYPLAYILMWCIPFMIHVLHFDGVRRSKTPLWLDLLSGISIACQGLVDCTLFMVQEKPWRHIRGSFWESLGLRMRISWFPERTLGGRTRDEMRDDERFARARRDQEAAQESADKNERDRLAAQLPDMASPSNRRLKGGINWWDTELDGDEALSKKRRKIRRGPDAGEDGQGKGKRSMTDE
jgi:hypothetical protein